MGHHRARDSGSRKAVGQRMDEARLWRLIEDQGEREPLITRSETRAAVQLLRRLGERGGEGADVAAELAGRLARRLPVDEQAHDGAECTRWAHLRPTAPSSRAQTGR
ncbi:hypothetical protein SAZ11_08060 [Streptomyces sp. FXJ1.4098]|nr:hypothetical protein [Streptomyces sp. FXJ1.4098]